jgi:hypothetical protein
MSGEQLLSVPFSSSIECYAEARLFLLASRRDVESNDSYPRPRRKRKQGAA